MEPQLTDAIGERDEAVRIHVFPPGTAAVSNWDDNARCELHVSDERSPVIHVLANVAGLRSLARHCLTLAQEGLERPQLVDFDADSGWFETTDYGLRVERAWD